MAELTICEVFNRMEKLIEGCKDFRCFKEKVMQEAMKCRQESEHTGSGPSEECPTCK